MNALTKNKVALYLAVIFPGGRVGGGVVAWNPARHTHGPPPSIGKACDSMKRRLQEKLSLTPDQMKKIEPIIERTGQQFRAVHRKSMEQIEEVIQRSNAEIAKELTAEQRVKLEEMDRERREFLQKRFKGPPPGR